MQHNKQTGDARSIAWRSTQHTQASEWGGDTLYPFSAAAAGCCDLQCEPYACLAATNIAESQPAVLTAPPTKCVGVFHIVPLPVADLLPSPKAASHRQQQVQIKVVLHTAA